MEPQTLLMQYKERTLPKALTACSTLFLENPISINWRTSGAGEVVRIRFPLGVCTGREGRDWVFCALFITPTEAGPPREWSLWGLDTSSLEHGVMGDGWDISSVKFSHRAKAAVCELDLYEHNLLLVSDFVHNY